MAGMRMDLIVRGLEVWRGARWQAFGRKGRRVIAAMDLPVVQPGQVVVIAGPNGAGKSTLLRALAGLLPARGQRHLGTVDLAGLRPAARARLVGFMPQSFESHAGLTVWEALMAALKLGGSAALAPRAEALLARFGLAELALAPVAALSGGQRQAVALAAAVACEPPLLLLDEPTSALDPARQYDLMAEVQALAREGRVVVAVLHDLAQAAQWADQIWLIRDGVLLAHGTPEAVLTPERLAQAYGLRARVERCSQGRLLVLADGRA